VRLFAPCLQNTRALLHDHHAPKGLGCFPSILNDMVNAVYVHAPDKSSGHRVQKTKISYNYIGILPATLLQNVQNAKTA